MAKETFDVVKAEMIRICLKGALNPYTKVNFEFESRSDLIVLMGPSGSGKSTILKALAGLDTFLSGDIVIDKQLWEKDGRKLKPSWERSCHWVPQDALLFPHLNVKQNIALANVYPVASFDSLVEAFAISPLLERMPRHLSGGERQRVSLVRSLMSPAKYLLWDEVFSALDEALLRSCRETAFHYVKEQDKKVIMVAHRVEDFKNCDPELWQVGSVGMHEEAKH